MSQRVCHEAVPSLFQLVRFPPRNQCSLCSSLIFYSDVELVVRTAAPSDTALTAADLREGMAADRPLSLGGGMYVAGLSYLLSCHHQTICDTINRGLAHTVPCYFFGGGGECYAVRVFSTIHWPGFSFSHTVLFVVGRAWSEVALGHGCFNAQLVSDESTFSVQWHNLQCCCGTTFSAAMELHSGCCRREFEVENDLSLAKQFDPDCSVRFWNIVFCCGRGLLDKQCGMACFCWFRPIFMYGVVLGPQFNAEQAWQQWQCP